MSLVSLKDGELKLFIGVVFSKGLFHEYNDLSNYENINFVDLGIFNYRKLLLCAPVAYGAYLGYASGA